MPLYDQVELLCQAIASQARAEAEQIAAQARQEADALVAAAQTRRQESLARTREEVAAQAQLTARSLVDRAQLEARRQAAQAKENLLNDILARGLEQLHAFQQTAAYQSWLQQALLAAVKQLGGDKFRVVAHPEEARWLTPELLAAAVRDCGCTLELAPAADVPAGGFVLVRADGRVRLDQTFQGIMARQRESLRAEIARSLWE
jgi:V/A-type H+/Na+-transporting ATPase subunit E